MSDRDRLHQIIDGLPQMQVEALLALLEPGRSIDDQEFIQRISRMDTEDEDPDDETVASVLAAEAECGEVVNATELRRRLAL